MTSAPKNPVQILYVDDEEKALHYFQQCFEDDYIIHTATNASDGFRILEQQAGRIGILMTDQRMPGESGVELMERVRQFQPDIIRILVTAFTDYDSAVKAVNEGRAWRYLHKPLDPELLVGVLAEAGEAYQTAQNRERLLSQKADDLRVQLMADKVSGMGILAEGLNHHMRNALTVVRAFIDLAPMKLMEEIEARHPRDPSFWIEMQSQAVGQLERIQSMLAHLALASHARKLARTDSVMLADLIRETHTAYAAEILAKQIRLSIDIADDFPALLVHGERFRQLLRLLFIEEITHLQNGDHVQITARVEDDALGEPHAAIILTDNGAWGGPHDSGSNLFDPFYTRSRRPDDFGVNMMACFTTMHLHGGTVSARRLDQQGLELTLRLPLDPEKNCQEAEEYLRGTLMGDAKWSGPLNRAA
jgi:response regulator RpfG family c-di-GMP phosphodiesterase